MTCGNIFNIQRFSLNDGPGIRTTVFMKGCNLRCFWCHNPESRQSGQQMQFFPSRCIGCGKCIDVCQNSAQAIVGEKRMYSRELCDNCGRCAEVCNTEALVLCGKSMTVDEVLKEAAKDIPFYRTTGGGVTFSGGEPMLQVEFLAGLLEKCKALSINTAVDTAGNVKWKAFERVLPHTDLFLYDVKCMDEKKHKESMGAGNALILENLALLAATGKEIWIRIPVIPGMNDNEEEMIKAAEYIKGLGGINKVDLFPFHKFGKEKYESLGMEYKAEKCGSIPEELLGRLQDVFLKNGFTAEIG